MHVTKIPNYPLVIDIPGAETIQEVIGNRAGSGNSHSVARILIPPGNVSEPHYHQHAIESYVILTGRATIKIDNAVLELDAGEAVLIEPDEIHQISNLEDTDLVFIAVCIPAWYPEDSFHADFKGEK